MKKAAVYDIQYGDCPDFCQDHPLFTLKTDQGIYYARTVVLAVGPANAPSLPSGLPSFSLEEHEGQLHSMKIQEFPAASVKAKMTAGTITNILVVGGGLTSAQLSDLAIRKGVTKVWHFMRGSCKVKPFDVDLSWMGKWRNVQQAAFWLADTDEGMSQRLLESQCLYIELTLGVFYRTTGANQRGSWRRKHHTSVQ